MTNAIQPGDAQPVPVSATGIGLRAPHYREVLERRPDVGWLEVHTENFMCGGPALDYLERVRAEYPLSLHGVGLSLGSADGLDETHLERFRLLAERFDPMLVSEHVSWSGHGGVYLNDLLPLPYTPDTLDVIAGNVDRLQDALGRRVLVENPSTYMAFSTSTMSEFDFLVALQMRTGCGLLLDVNNIYVSAQNHGLDAVEYLESLPAEAVGEIHVAGHQVNDIGSGRRIHIDDHGSAPPDPVWELYRRAIARTGPVPTLIEWDTRIPELDVLVAEAAKADTIQRELYGAAGTDTSEVRHARTG
jgi:uncharacterized protein (UPF0276 family)